MRLQNLIPARLRLKYKIWKRQKEDQASQLTNSFAQKSKHVLSREFCHELRQPIKRSYLYENKLHNIRVAAQEINQVIIKPNQVFSFWDVLGEPTVKRNYKIGRNIINGKLVQDVGGGLCQVSGILYYLSLQCGLMILERYNHSTDIYTEEERFTPLGSDATIVFGYKDLRFQNPFSCPIQFEFDVTGDELILYLKTEEPIERSEIQFTREEKELGIVVRGCIDAQEINNSFYRI